MGATRKTEGYLLRLSPFREKDAMALMLSREGFISFLARGTYGNGKSKAAMLPLGLSRYELNVGKGGKYSLKEAESIKTAPYREDLNFLALVSVVSETLSKVSPSVDPERAYKLLEAVLSCLRDGGDPLTLTCMFLARTAKLLGVAPETHACMVCGAKEGITAFSYLEGGYFCKEDAERMNIVPSGLKYLREIEFIHNRDPRKAAGEPLPAADALEHMKELRDYLKDRAGVTVRSLGLLLNG